LIRTLRSSWFFVVLAIALAGCNGMQSGGTPSNASAGAGTADIAFYRSVLDKVHQSYVEPVSDGKLIDNSLKGMLTGLDPHSDYLSEREYQDMLDDSAGEFAGIGAELTR
jgi:carboxyl-terminal processing protease